MKIYLITLPVLCLALGAQAGDPPAPQAVPGEIIIEQRTHVLMGTRGAVTQRYMTASMKMKGSERVISTQPGSQWTISEGDKYMKEEPRVSSRVTRERGLSHEPCLPRRRINGALLGNRTEDGTKIAGEWTTYECGPTASRPMWTERVETWYRGDMVGKEKVLRPHRRETTSPYEHLRVDYTYLQTTRMHTSLFDEKLP